MWLENKERSENQQLLGVHEKSQPASRLGYIGIIGGENIGRFA
ncbi:hypothetical protein B808_1066 [Fructilactobacillus florum 8D]|uniref:Uncharacterized protein n=1 Tax=Fructilactobacillus florum 8D TaxID=1221538 RepID=W9ECX0_9LACO|nr:hypothetical protein B808_1066 [Fructilactobacillus florum 8D]